MHAGARVRRVIDEASLAHGTRVSLSVLEIVSNVAWDITEVTSQLFETLLSFSCGDQNNISTVDLADCESFCLSSDLSESVLNLLGNI